MPRQPSSTHDPYPTQDDSDSYADDSLDMGPYARSQSDSNSSPPSPVQPFNPKKKHACTSCGRSFTTSGHLARHSRVHTGERNHRCPFPGCQTRCSRQDNLQQHYRIHLSPGSRRNSGAATRAALREMNKTGDAPTGHRARRPKVSNSRRSNPFPPLQPPSTSFGAEFYQASRPASISPPPDTPPPLVQARPFSSSTSMTLASNPYSASSSSSASPSPRPRSEYSPHPPQHVPINPLPVPMHSPAHTHQTPQAHFRSGAMSYEEQAQVQALPPPPQSSGYVDDPRLSQSQLHAEGSDSPPILSPLNLVPRDQQQQHHYSYQPQLETYTHVPQAQRLSPIPIPNVNAQVTSLSPTELSPHSAIDHSHQHPHYGSVSVAPQQHIASAPTANVRHYAQSSDFDTHHHYRSHSSSRDRYSISHISHTSHQQQPSYTQSQFHQPNENGSAGSSPVSAYSVSPHASERGTPINTSVPYTQQPQQSVSSVSSPVVQMHANTLARESAMDVNVSSLGVAVGGVDGSGSGTFSVYNSQGEIGPVQSDGSGIMAAVTGYSPYANEHRHHQQQQQHDHHPQHYHYHQQQNIHSHSQTSSVPVPNPNRYPSPVPVLPPILDEGAFSHNRAAMYFQRHHQQVTRTHVVADSSSSGGHYPQQHYQSPSSIVLPHAHASSMPYLHHPQPVLPGPQYQVPLVSLPHENWKLNRVVHGRDAVV